MSVAARGVVREEMEEDEEHYLEREVEEGGDEDENYHEEEDAMQANIMNSGRSVDVWINGGTKKAEVLRELIKSFSSLIQSRPKEGAMLDYRGKYRVEDMEYMKLMDASKYVIRAKSIFVMGSVKHYFRSPINHQSLRNSRALVKNENFDTREFILFISRKKWVRSILRPLLELCAFDDSTLALRICGLCLVLFKRTSEKTNKILASEVKKVKVSAPRKSLLEKAKENEEKEKEKEKSDDEKSDEDAAFVVPTGKLQAMENAHAQLTALLSFKEALCTEACNSAVVNAFRTYWTKEQQETSEENKQGVAICFSYLRRLLAIDTYPGISSPGEVQAHKAIQARYILYLRKLFIVIPGIWSELGASNYQYHNDWLTDIILISYFILHSYEATELYDVYKTGGIVKNLLADVDEDNTVRKEPSSASDEVIVPEALQKKNRVTIGLMSKLKQEKCDRLIKTGANSNGHFNSNSRFRGVYLKPINSSTMLGNNNFQCRSAVIAAQVSPGDEDKAAKKVYKPTSLVVSNPFASIGATAPQAKMKLNKRNLTFSNSADMGKQYDDSLSAEDRQRSSIVVATLTEELSKEICLKAFIRRINEDLRRDEMMIGPELELRYFEILQKILQYNRLKLDNEYKKFDHVNNEWKPSIRNIIDALDKMSFRRVTVSMETLAKNESKRDDVVIPMLLFKEQICYLRLLLDSKEDVHHELAVAALYRLFYATSQRLDPLPRLLSEWKPNTYPKKHLEALVELVHETMKTLETASSLIKNELMSDSLLKKYKRSNKKKEMDMEQYIMACARFDVNEYFKKLASNHTVWMYSRLLYSYDINDKKVNHYIYTFMHRMWNFKLERDSTVAVLPSEANGAQVDKSNDDQAVNLGYMLFHINTLQIFSKIVNDRRVYDRDSDKFKHLIPFVSLIKMITRRLFEQSTKNRMIFVEILFQHPHAQEFCLELDSVYQAASYAVPRKEESDDSDNDNISTNKSNRNLVLEKVLESSDDSSDNYGEEFDENNISAAFLPNANDTKKKKLAKKSKKNKISKKRKLSLVDSSDSESDKEERTQSQRKSSRQARQEWSKEEDDLLRQQYSLYAGTNSIFTSIANSSEFRATGKNRTPAQVERRVNQLSLHMTASDSSDAENEDILDIVHPTTPSASAGLASDQSLASTGDFGTLKSANVVSDVSTTKSKSPFDASKPIWDSDEEPDTTDIFEKRSMGLIDDIKKTFSVKNAGGKLKKARREDLSDDEDDMFDATEKEISTANSVSAETFPQIDAALNSRLTTSKSRSMVIADDDDDE